MYRYLIMTHFAQHVTATEAKITTLRKHIVHNQVQNTLDNSFLAQVTVCAITS